MTLQWALIGAAWIALIVLYLGYVALLKQVGALSEEVFPKTQAVGPRIGTRISAELRGGYRVLFFVEANCVVCRELVNNPRMSELAFERSDFAFIAREDSWQGYLGGTVITSARSLFDSLSISVTPFAVALDSEMRITAAEPIGSTLRGMAFLTAHLEPDKEGALIDD